MAEMSILDELTPPEDRIKSVGVDKSILEAVAERKISYPAEIVGDTGINRQTVFDHVRQLVKAGKLERVYLHNSVPDVMKGRISELWEMGLKGAMIRRMSWYKLVDDDRKKTN
jgi:predicted ArsR family transcriptional regulator